MTRDFIFAFVLVLLVVTSAVTVSLIFATRREASATRLSAVQLRRALADYGLKWNDELKKLKDQSPIVLAAKVDELSDAVGKLAETHRKFAGRMDRRYQLDRGTAEADPYVDDPKWRALRAAQEASTGGPTR